MTDSIPSMGGRDCLKGIVLRVKFGYNPNSSSYPGSPLQFLFFIIYIIYTVVIAIVGFCIACILYGRHKRKMREQEENK